MKKIRRLISFDEEQLDELKRYAQKRGVSASFVVRDAIAEYFELHEMEFNDEKTPAQRILESVERLEKLNEGKNFDPYTSLKIDEILYGKKDK